jgi:hypothetical protein
VRLAAGGVLTAVLVAGAAAVWWPEPDQPPPREPPPRFALDAPRGWSVEVANVLSPVDSTAWFGLWEDAAGHWLLAETEPATRAPMGLLGAARVSDRYDAALLPGSPARLQLEVPAGRVRVVLTGSGVAPADLIATAAAVRPVDDRPPLGEAPEGFALMATGTTVDAARKGSPIGEVVYVVDGYEVTLTFGRAQPGVDTETVRRVLGDGDLPLRRTERDGLVFTVAGRAPAVLLDDALARIRPVDEGTWQRLVDMRRPGLRLGPLLQVAEGETTGGRRWTAGIRLARRDGEWRFGWAAAPLDAPLGPPFGPRPDLEFPTEPTFTTLVVPGATYVFAMVPRDGRDRLLGMYLPGRDATAEFVDLGPDVPVLVAAYAFDEPAQVVIEIVER